MNCCSRRPLRDVMRGVFVHVDCASQSEAATGRSGYRQLAHRDEIVAVALWAT